MGLDQGINPHGIECRQIMGQAFDTWTAGTQIGLAAQSKLLKCRGERL